MEGRFDRDLHRRLSDRLLEARAESGGFGPRPGGTAEPEPTALAAIALDDAGARAWLQEHQRPDGGFALGIGDVVNDSATALAALALPPGTARDRAMDHVVGERARPVPASSAVPHDPAFRGWAWTLETSGWVEPTARALLALRLLRPSATEAIQDAVGMLIDRECVGGGWNYGNPVVLGETLPPFAQTTAVTLVALQGTPSDLSERGMAALRLLWRKELGGLTLATSLAAFRAVGDPEAPAVERAIATVFESTGFLDDVVSLAWAALATGPGLSALTLGSGS